jgi:hypothetical protein
LNEGCNAEHEFPDAVVITDLSAKWRVVTLEVFGAYAVEYRRLGSGFGRPIGRANAVLEQACSSAVANKNQAIAIDRRCLADVDAGIAVADVSGDNTIGKTLADLRGAEELVVT